MLGFMAVSGVLGWLNIRGLALRVHFPDEIYAGLETLISLRMENRKRWSPSFLITVALSGSSTSFILLDPGQTCSGSLLMTFQERGPHNGQKALITSPFPVNFFVRSSLVNVGGSCTVFPAPRRFHPLFPTAKSDAGGALASSAKGYEGEVVKIMDYQGGEPLKLIHWRLSAKHEVFKVKELTTFAHEPVLLEPDLSREVEKRLCHLAYLVNRLVRGGHPVGLKLGPRVIAPAATRVQRLKLLGELAIYGKG
jgi:uncharacterized protein (DUF58 family)